MEECSIRRAERLQSGLKLLVLVMAVRGGTEESELVGLAMAVRAITLFRRQQLQTQSPCRLTCQLVTRVRSHSALKVTTRLAQLLRLQMVVVFH